MTQLWGAQQTVTRFWRVWQTVIGYAATIVFLPESIVCNTIAFSLSSYSATTVKPRCWAVLPQGNQFNVLAAVDDKLYILDPFEAIQQASSLIVLFHSLKYIFIPQNFICWYVVMFYCEILATYILSYFESRNSESLFHPDNIYWISNFTLTIMKILPKWEGRIWCILSGTCRFHCLLGFREKAWNTARNN